MWDRLGLVHRLAISGSQPFVSCGIFFPGAFDGHVLPLGRWDYVHVSATYHLLSTLGDNCLLPGTPLPSYCLVVGV